jgi:hypothetical protein
MQRSDCETHSIRPVSIRSGVRRPNFGTWRVVGFDFRRPTACSVEAMTRASALTLFAGGFLLACSTEPAQTADGEQTSATGDKGIFRSTIPLDGEIRLSGDFTKLKAEADAIDPPSVRGSFAAPALGITDPLDVDITVRGNTARDKGECTFVDDREDP